MNKLILDPTQEWLVRQQAKINARNEEKAAKTPPRLKNMIGECLSPDFAKIAHSVAAKLPKVSETGIPVSGEPRDLLYKDEKGQTCILKADVGRMNDLEAMERHGNDPIRRFDEWDFPGNARRREFLLAHDFGELLKKSLIALDSEHWVYAYGGVGLGKTALAIRTVWERLKTRPSEKASFVSVNEYMSDFIKRELSEEADIRKGNATYTPRLKFHKVVILDDLDKMSFKTDYRKRAVLALFERLIRDEHLVFITAQMSLLKLFEKYENDPELKPPIDRLRDMCFVLPEFTGDSNRKYSNK